MSAHRRVHGVAATAHSGTPSAPTRLDAVATISRSSCQLGSLSASEGCPAGLLGTQRLASAPSVALAAGAAIARSGQSPPGNGHGGSEGGGHPTGPTPGPAPSGASGGAAAGGSGGAFSAFFTLAGLLLLAAPLAMRRLRLASRPWLTAFFVLIPERPG